MNPLYQQFGQQQSMNYTPAQTFNPLGNAIQKARSILGSIQNPQQFVLQSLSDMNIQIPPEIRNDPNQIANYLVNNVALNPLQKQILGL